MKNNSILIQNIYYMLAYAFQNLRRDDTEKMDGENFEHIEDLMAAVLLKGLTRQLRQGLYRMYAPCREDLSMLRGQLDMEGTLRNRIRRQQKLSCMYDELSEDHMLNQILKTAALYLVRDSGVQPPRKDALRRVLRAFQDVREISPDCFSWDRLSFHRNNGSYKMLLYICRCIFEWQLFRNHADRQQFSSFMDDQRMCRLYEKFILEYYRYHYPELQAAASRVPWNLEKGDRRSLPVMKTDITLCRGERILIIDAKYYSHIWQIQSLYGSRTIHSGNLYQIFTYVKNKDKNHTGQVSGMLLYAKTNEDTVPDDDFQIDGSRISVKTLDLNQHFAGIKKQLDDITEQF